MHDVSRQLSMVHDALYHFRGNRLDTLGRSLLRTVEHRLGGQVGREILDALPRLDARLCGSVLVPAELGAPGQVALDGQGGFWTMTHEGLQGRSLVHFDECLQVAESWEPGCRRSLLMARTSAGVCWFDMDSLAIRDRSGDVVQDFSVYKGLLGKHVLVSSLACSSQGQVAAVVMTEGYDSGVVLFVREGRARVVAPSEYDLPQGVLFLGEELYVQDAYHGLLHRVDPTSLTVSKAVALPLSCLARGVAGAGPERLVSLVNSGKMLVLLQHFKPTSVLELHGLQSILGSQETMPKFFDAQHKDGTLQVVLAEPLAGQIFLIEIADSALPGPTQEK